jgi:hypothetical protein
LIYLFDFSGVAYNLYASAHHTQKTMNKCGQGGVAKNIKKLGAPGMSSWETMTSWWQMQTTHTTEQK